MSKKKLLTRRERVFLAGNQSGKWGLWGDRKTDEIVSIIKKMI
jgi:hypothetical protein